MNTLEERLHAAPGEPSAQEPRPEPPGLPGDPDVGWDSDDDDGEEEAGLPGDPDVDYD